MSACQRCSSPTFGRLCAVCKGERTAAAAPLHRCPPCGDTFEGAAPDAASRTLCVPCKVGTQPMLRAIAVGEHPSRLTAPEVLDRWKAGLLHRAFPLGANGRVSQQSFAVLLARLTHELRAVGVHVVGHDSADGWGALITGADPDSRHLFTVRDLGGGALQIDGSIEVL